MSFGLDKSIDILKRTPYVLNSLLRDIDEFWANQNEGENTWSPFDVVGHLVHGEKTDWITRAKIILNDSEAKVFEPFDKFAQFEDSKGKSLNDLLDQFEILRSKNLKIIEDLNISEGDFEKTGIHPALGPVSLK